MFAMTVSTDGMNGLYFLFCRMGGDDMCQVPM